MAQFDSPEVNEALQHLTRDLIKQFPESAEIFSQLQRGELDPVEGMRRLAMITSGQATVVEKLAEEAFLPLHQTGGVPLISGSTPPLIYKANEHVQALNPLVEASIAERAQFDGDVPEFRTGPLPAGATPAVPVRSDAVSPVALGVVLEQASREVSEELSHALEDRSRGITSLLEDAKYSDHETALQIKDHLPPVPTGVSGYAAGRVPAFREMPSVAGSALATLSDSQRQHAAYQTLATTQGRRSAVSAIEEALLVGLIEEGWELQARTPATMPVDVPIYAEWSSQVTGEEETNANFDFIAVAGRSLLRQLTEQVRSKGLPKDPVLEVMPKNTINIRQVGWAARIVSKQ